MSLLDTHDRELDGRRPVGRPDALAPFVDTGVLTSADVHVATTLCRLHEVADDDVLLGVALASRAPRVGHSCLDVDAVADALVHELPGGTEVDDDTVAALPWPDPDDWLATLRASPLAVAAEPGTASPIVVEGRRVYLTRYRDHEAFVAADLRARAGALAPAVDHGRLQGLLDRVFPDAPADDPQRLAAVTAATRRLAVVAGGPGTGKTWTVARILAALVDQAHARGDRLQVALVAPTGKAAARLDQGLRDAVATMDVEEDLRVALDAVDRGSTIHRLLGVRSNSRFWHDRDRPVPHDVVVVDETSMASLSLVAHLLEAVRADAHVVLVGDPDQLASVEAGSVLADLVGGGRSGPSVLADGLVVLERPRRFGPDSGIGQLARAVRAGDPDAVVGTLRDAGDVAWIPTSDPVPADLADVRDLLTAVGRSRIDAARDGDVDAALDQLDRSVVLCAHRRGRDGVAGWNQRVDRWLAEEVPGWRPWAPWQPGQAVLALGNDRQLQVFNGDLGVVVATPHGARVAFHRPSATDAEDPVRRPVPPTRLDEAEPVHAMTIHKSQGSQWDHVVVVLPAGGSRILTRELLYTAATRAADRLTVIGDESVVRHAVGRPIRRASGLADRLRP